MALDVEKLEVVNNTEKSQFEIPLEDGDIGLVEYKINGKNIIFTHTEVPPKYEGMGVGSKLARHVMDFARDEGLKVQPLCPFINAYVRRHKEYHNITWGY